MTIKDILIVMNSSNDLGFKYPIGNKELTEKVKELEKLNKIKYDEWYHRWKKV
jgi:hypothetical protein